MRFYNTQHPFDCGIDLHAPMMYVCILDPSGVGADSEYRPSPPRGSGDDREPPEG